MPDCTATAAIKITTRGPILKAAGGHARNEYEKSLAEYRDCVNANSNDLKACDGKRSG